MSRKEDKMNDTSQNLLLDRPLLVLDLDECLVYSTEKPLEGLTADFRAGEYYVHKRPHVDAFLTRVWALYNVAVWSKGGTGYVEPAVKALMESHPQPLFVWSFPRCTRRWDQWDREEYHIKDLKKVRKLGFPKERMLIVDDTARNGERNYGSIITVREFTGQQDDVELLHLATYLESLASHTNFRTIEKRYWRNQFAS
jgi:RNA polymerase II subunit A small phosphatase-like protein